MRIEVLGVPVDNVNMDEALSAAFRLMERPGAAYCVTPNAEIVYETLTDADLKACVCQADLILPDGAGVVLRASSLARPWRHGWQRRVRPCICWAASRVWRRLRQRICGRSIRDS